MDLIELLGVTLDRVVILLLSNEEVPSSDKFRSLNVTDVLHRHLLSHHLQLGCPKNEFSK